MKQVYPPRHPASLDASPPGQDAVARDEAVEPAPPGGKDAASPGHADGAPRGRLRVAANLGPASRTPVVPPPDCSNS